MITTHRILLAGLFAALSVPGAAQAKQRDSDRDGMPNAFELRYHLKVHAKDAAKDKDKDGLSNAGEYQAGTNPRKADSDADGVRDADEDCDEDGVGNEDEEDRGTHVDDADSDDDGIGDENEVAGVVATYANGVLTIRAAGGTEVSAPVNAKTEFECRTVSATAARLSRDDEDEREESDDDAPRSTTPSSAPVGSTSTSGSSLEDDDGDDDDSKETSSVSCDATALVAGVKVREAEIEDGAFHSVKLVIGG